MQFITLQSVYKVPYLSWNPFKYFSILCVEQTWKMNAVIKSQATTWLHHIICTIKCWWWYDVMWRKFWFLLVLPWAKEVASCELGGANWSSLRSTHTETYHNTVHQIIMSLSSHVNILETLTVLQDTLHLLCHPQDCGWGSCIKVKSVQEAGSGWSTTKI